MLLIGMRLQPGAMIALALMDVLSTHGLIFVADQWTPRQAYQKP